MADSLFKWRHIQNDNVGQNVRWYCRYSLSHRDLEAMIAERGVEVVSLYVEAELL